MQEQQDITCKIPLDLILISPQNLKWIIDLMQDRPTHKGQNYKTLRTK